MGDSGGCKEDISDVYEAGVREISKEFREFLQIGVRERKLWVSGLELRWKRGCGEVLGDGGCEVGPEVVSS